MNHCQLSKKDFFLTAYIPIGIITVHEKPDARENADERYFFRIFRIDIPPKETRPAVRLRDFKEGGLMLWITEKRF